MGRQAPGAFKISRFVRGVAVLLLFVVSTIPSAQAIDVPGIADITLAGQASGATVSSYLCLDSASLNSPVDLGLALVAGQAVQFSSVTGAVSVSGAVAMTPPDGDLGSGAQSTKS